MKKAKKLTLKKKTIRELTNDELGSVAGGATIIPKCSPTVLCPTSPEVCG
jgi:natural product precursor